MDVASTEAGAGASPLTQQFFGERGVLFLNVNSDCVDSRSASLEQHVTRYEAFVESLHRRSRWGAQR